MADPQNLKSYGSPVDKNRGRGLFWIGILMIDLGILALLLAGIASFFVERLIGVSLLVTGAVGVFAAYSLWHTRVFVTSLIFALLAFSFGVYLTLYPETSVATLTMLICALLVVEGAFQMALAFDLRPAKGWPWMVLSAATSITVGAFMVLGVPESSRVVVCALLGFSFLTTGIAFTVSAQNIARL